MPSHPLHARIQFLLLSAALIIGTPAAAATVPDATANAPTVAANGSADANTKEIGEMAEAVKRAQLKRGAQASQAGANIKNDIGKDGKMTGNCAIVLTSKTGKKTTLAKELSETTVAHMVKSMPPYMNATAECAPKVKK